MALSGLFLVVFLTQHFLINITSVFSESIFNMISHFMGNEPYRSIYSSTNFNFWSYISLYNGLLS